MADADQESSPYVVLEDMALDGVHYALLKFANKDWRLGAVTPGWRELIDGVRWQEALSGNIPDIWLCPADVKTPPLAAMCCGLGAVWPGMGRELYASFPEARKAMNYIAGLADWDILGLMDESSLDKISLTRWQIPYLFMLEYAQWQLLRALGLAPQIACGHSLGELIALCVSGIMDAKSAWYMLETRSIHMAGLEARSGRQGGMLAVPASGLEVSEALSLWPELRISNRNTPTQFVLSGPREQLMEARRHFRRKKIPAVMLGMDLAFHNPAMRILRDISVLRLSGICMHKPRAKMLSCINASPYPDTALAISEAIADLDENAVDWVNLVQSIRSANPDAAFLELGPQEILCGITSELAPDSLCIAVDKKGHEREAMAAACARLYAAGYLDLDAIRTAYVRQSHNEGDIGLAPAWQGSEMSEPVTDLADIPESEKNTIIQIIAEATGRSAEAISPDLDPRLHLGLRSANFPFLVFEAEKRLGRPILIENLAQIASVGDLIRFLTGRQSSRGANRAETRPDFALGRHSIQRYSPDGAPCPFSPRITNNLAAPMRIIWRVLDGAIVLPDQAAAEADNHDYNIQDYAPQAIIMAPKPLALDGIDTAALAALQNELQTDIAAVERWQQAQLLVIQRFVVKGANPDLEVIRSWFATIRPALQTWEGAHTAIAWLAPAIEMTANDSAIVIAHELASKDEQEIIWSNLPEQKFTADFCAASGFYEGLTPVQPASAGCHQYLCQFSDYAEPELAGHGPGESWSPSGISGKFTHSPWLSPGIIVNAIFKSIKPFSNNWQMAGLHDISFSCAAVLPPGITRECVISVCSHLRLPLNGIETRNYNANMEIATLTESGRKSGIMQHLCDCSFSFAPEIAPLNTNISQPPYPANEYGEVDPGPFYRHLGFSKSWQRIISAIIANDNTGCEARIKFDRKLPEPACFQALDAFWQAAMLCLSHITGGVPALTEDWRFARLALLQLGPEQISLDEYELFLVLAWSDDRLRRFNGVIRNSANGAIAMTIHNLEFDHVSPRASTGQ